MSFVNVLYIFGAMLVTLATGTILPLLVAGATGESAQIAGFMSVLAFAGFLGGGLMLGLRDMPRRSGMREAVILILLAWFLAPLFASVPFLSHAAFPNFTSAYFEATSALTTTGATVLENLNEQPRSIILWRAILQWIGGFGTLLMSVGILSALSFGGLPVVQPPVRVREGHQLLDRLRPVANFLAPTYILLSLACFILIWLSGIPPFDAFCIALSTLSTGGFMTVDGSLSEFSAPGAELIITIFMIIGAVNFVLHCEAARGNFRPYKKEPEVRALLVLILIVGLVFFLLTAGDGDRSRNLFSSIFNAASLLTTTGFGIGKETPMNGVPPAFILAAVLIGGSALSTAGGLKLIRLILLFRHNLTELERLSHPHGVKPVRYGLKTVEPRVIAHLWLHFVCLTVLVGIVAAGVALYKFDFSVAMSATIAAVSNAGPVLIYTSGNTVTYADFPQEVLGLLAWAMVLGRVEILVFLPIFNRSYWQA